ncbi:MAG: DUF4340 domain-containing protein [Planctomycetes bacterium]|nr:DUF4340 domain-containing protein [Planctomycetota bacterium]
MGLRAIVLLVLVVGGLAAVLLLTDEKRPARDVAEVAVLDGRSLREARRIWWQFEGRPPVEVSRTPDGGFGLTEPIVDAVSPGYLKQICDAWDSAQMRAVPLQDDAEGRAKAGFEPPELRLLAEYPDGARLAVDVGAPGPLGTSRFVRRDGKIWEGGDALFESLRVGVDDLRDRAVFRTTPQLLRELRVEQLAATGKREALHLQRNGDEWRLLEPVVGRADANAAARFVTAVLSLRVDDFAPGAARLPTTEPAIVVTVRGMQGDETVKLWLERGQMYGRLPGRNVTFSSDNRQYGQIFENAAEALRARILVPLGNVYEQVGEVVVDPGQGRGERLRLLRDGSLGEWRLVEPVTYAAAATPCNETLQAINNLHAVEFVDAVEGGPPVAADPRLGLAAGRLQVSVRSPERTEPIDLWFGDELRKNDLDLVYACRADEPATVVLVPKLPVDHLRRPWTDYCDRALVRQSAPIEWLDLARRTGARRSFRRAGEHWQLDGAAGQHDDVGSFANDVLRDIDGRRVVDVRGEAFAIADWTLLMRRENGDELGRLRVWERGGDAPLVVQSGDSGPVGFELAPIHDKQLRALWQ